MIKIARIYQRVSTDDQELGRQNQIIQEAKAAGYHIAGVYREKASGARADRPELLRLVNDLQPGEAVIAEKMDRISRLPLPEAEQLIASIREKGAILVVPGIVDFSDLIVGTNGIAKIVLESVQELLFKLTLQMARDEYEDRRERQRQGVALAKKQGKYSGRKANHQQYKLIVELKPNNSIEKTAELANCSVSQVKRIWALHKKGLMQIES